MTRPIRTAMGALVAVMAASVGLAAVVAGGAADPAAPAAIGLEPLVDGLESPVLLLGDGSGGGLRYVVEQGGRVRVIEPDGSLREQPFLDLTDRVTAGGEQGLLGLAFHPAFAEHGRLFVDYTRVADGATVISEFQATDGVADPASERVLLVIPQPFPNHNGGMIAFDRDGMLLIGMGDGGGGGDPQGNGQELESLLGKLLRIDVDEGATADRAYGIPDDMPFLRQAGARPEIWALGLRNPWRFWVDRATGDTFIGDVGQGAWEELDVIPAGDGGRDFGWNITEGPECFRTPDCDRTGLTEPVAVIAHGDGDCSIIGGPVYRGGAIPSLVGNALIGDYCTGIIQALNASTAVSTSTATPVPLVTLDGPLSSFGEDDQGELYAVDHGGRVLRIVGE
jgi:glucose/arabinose dehydrogenase